MTEKLETLVARSLVEDRLTIVSIASRPGARRFFMALEYELFPPASSLNSEFDYYFIHWPKEAPMAWTVVIMPLIRFPEARRIAKEAGMRIANGVPTLLGIGEGELRFPADHTRVHTLENDAGSPVYLPGGDKFIREEEQRWIEKFMVEKHGPNWRDV